MSHFAHNVGSTVILSARASLDAILRNCSRYFQRHQPEAWAKTCSPCTRRTTEANGAPCGMCFTEEIRLLSLLRGAGLVDKGRGNVRVIRNTYGRIEVKKGRVEFGGKG